MSEAVADPTLETQVLPDLPENEPETPETPETTTETQETPETPPSRDLELAAALKDLATSVRGRETEPATPPPTQEEIAAYWKVYDPEASDKEFMRKWFRMNPDATDEEVQQARVLFASVQKGLMTQAVAAARNYIQMARSEIDRDYGPIREYVEEAKRTAIRDRFFAGYSGLNDPKYTKIIDATARSLDNQYFKDEASYFKALAEGAAESIRAILPEFQLGSNTTKQPGQKPRLPRSSAGGGGGAGKGVHDAMAPTGRQNDIDSLEDGAE